MKVELLHNTPLWIAMKAIRICWQSQDKSDNMGEKDLALIERVALKNKHGSTIEHLNYTYDIDGISRALLQELIRHRHASYSVKSTRYTLKELKEAPIMWYDAPKDCDWKTGKRFLVMTGDSIVDGSNIYTLGLLQNKLKRGISNDIAKYCLPEAFKTSLVMTINARSLQNLLQLRTHKSALWEFRKLAKKLYEVLPEDHKFLFKDFIYKGKEK